MKAPLRFLPLMLALAFAGSAHAEDAGNPEAAAAEIGRINGQALACGHAEIAARAKRLIIAAGTKTRAVGERFESSTDQAFRQQNSASECPPRAALAVALESAARRAGLSAPTHREDKPAAETPDVGVNPRYLLQAANGRAIMDSDFRDRFQLITFGYTYCPDICPTTLVEMADILKRLDGQAAQLQPIFISLDPERDTLAVLRSYTGFFDTRILGATGSPELVRRAAGNFKVRYEKVTEPGAPADRYSLDHSAGMYLLAPGGQFITRFPYGTPAADIAERIGKEVKLRASAAEAK